MSALLEDVRHRLRRAFSHPAPRRSQRDPGQYPDRLLGPAGIRQGGGPATGGGGAVRAAAFLYVWWVLVWSPFLADRHFHAMRAAVTGQEFQHRFRLARLRNPFQPYYLAEAADRVQRGTEDLDPENYALCHGWLRTAIRLEPGEPGFHRDLARVYVRAFRERFHDAFTRDRAIEAYAEAFRLNPTDPRPLVEKARFERLVGRPEAGLEALGFALRVEPAYSAARLERLEILLALGRTGEFRRERDGFDRTLRDLAETRPRNGYEESILALDRARWDRLQRVELPDSGPP
ncbi:MAG: hypothetical protein HY509_03555 [Acidobacteria bacterium]|nr:hypothetical protein [Acidobacteriota bacterium]